MIAHIYGSYNFWTWLKSEFIDSVPLQTLMMIDKQYVDHKYSSAKDSKEQDLNSDDFFAEIERQKQEIAQLTNRR